MASDKRDYYEVLGVDKSVSEEMIGIVKSIRDEYKKTVGAIREDYFYDSPEQLQQELLDSQINMEVLARLVKAFSKAFSATQSR